jgi:Mg2+ and Co2+ transporter CorA
MLESFRDVLSSAMEVYLTVVSNRTNDVVKVLTVFSIILMTGALLAGHLRHERASAGAAIEGDGRTS